MGRHLEFTAQKKNKDDQIVLPMPGHGVKAEEKERDALLDARSVCREGPICTRNGVFALSVCSGGLWCTRRVDRGHARRLRNPGHGVRKAGRWRLKVADAARFLDKVLRSGFGHQNLLAEHAPAPGVANLVGAIRSFGPMGSGRSGIAICVPKERRIA